MLKKLGIMCLLWTSILCANGCTKLQTSTHSACMVPFDYGDEGVNAQNARALLMHYCLCKQDNICR